MAQQARERGIPTPTESGATVPVAPDGSDRHLENLADELEAEAAAPTEAGADDGTASSGGDREDAQRVEIMADKDGSLEPESVGSPLATITPPQPSAPGGMHAGGRGLFTSMRVEIWSDVVCWRGRRAAHSRPPRIPPRPGLPSGWRVERLAP